MKKQVIFSGLNLSIIIDNSMLLITEIINEIFFKLEFPNTNAIAKEVRFGKEVKPIIVWNVNEICNMTCPHCYASAKRNKKQSVELSKEQSKKLLKILWEYGIKVIIFSGGEPLMRKDILSLISFAKDLGFQCHLSTNGVLITKEVAKALSELKVSYVGISIDGLPEFNDAYRGFPKVFLKQQMQFVIYRSIKFQLESELQ